MLANTGFILVPLTENEDEKNMRPFFPYVLNSSIICADPVVIDKYLKLTSERWNVVSGVDSVDKTSYTFECNYGNKTTDDANEEIGSTYLNATVQYDLYRNGFMDVEGIIRLNGQKLTFGDDRSLFLKRFYLPYAIPDSTFVETSVLFGNIEGVSLVASLEADKISNTNLNPSGSKNQYYHKLAITEIVPAAGGDTVPLDLIYRSVDDAYSIYTYDEYVGSYIPIKFKISGVQYR